MPSEPLKSSGIDLIDPVSRVEGVLHAQHTTPFARFDTSSARDWRELIRDITATANSGGGQIYLAAQIDEQDILRRLAHHTNREFSDVAVHSRSQGGRPATMITVGPALFPISFSPHPDSAAAEGAEQTHVVTGGGFYFRHGDHSEPATTSDMRTFIERLLHRVQRRWLQRLRRLVKLPMGALLEQPGATRDQRLAEKLKPVRIVTDPDAPALQPQDVERLYPWRQKDLLRELNARLGRRMLNSYDIQAVRRQHQLDERPDFVFNLPGAGRRYSPAAAEWMMQQYARDPEFFRHARAADHEIMKLRRQKPR